MIRALNIYLSAIFDVLKGFAYIFLPAIVVHGCFVQNFIFPEK